MGKPITEATRERMVEAGKKRPHHLIMRMVAGKLAKLPSLEERFEAKVDRREDEHGVGCWSWKAAKHERGYTRLWAGKDARPRVQYGHEISLKLAGVKIPKGMFVDHMCMNHECTNPLHLRVVTAKVSGTENCSSPMARNAAKTHCPHGHPYSPENTAINLARVKKTSRGHPTDRPRPGRMCLTCYPHYWKHAIIPRPKPPAGYCAEGERRLRKSLAQNNLPE